MPTAEWFRLDVATRERVYVAALREFGRHGYSNGNLAAVAAEAGLTEGALHTYITDKLEFFAFICDEVSRRTREAMEREIAALDFDQSFTDWFIDICFVWSEFYAEHPLERGIQAATNLEIDNTVRGVVMKTAEQHYLQVIRPLLQLWRDKGELRQDSDDDVITSVILMILPFLCLAPYYDGLDAVLDLRGRTPEQQRPIIRQLISGLSPIWAPK
ncbi:MAG TPA: TetR/AcrR family transcriptional regulator [Streptosporangiaceae bacterium]|jgi:AcrR family transcriptional regulator